MKTNKKHLLSVAIFLLICLLMMPISVAAASNSDAEAKIGSKTYATLEAAIQAVQNKQTIKLLRNITLDSRIKLKRNVTFTLDLNGKKIQEDDEESGDLSFSKGKVTIKNGTTEVSVTTGKSASVTVTNCNIYNLDGGGKVTIKSGTIHLLETSGTVKIENGNISSIYQFGGTVTIQKGNIGGLSVYGGSMLIKGGTFKGTSDSPLIIVAETGIVKIKGGTFVNTKDPVIYMEENDDGIMECKLTVSGGKIRCTAKNQPAISIITSSRKKAASRISVKLNCVTAKSGVKIKYLS